MEHLFKLKKDRKTVGYCKWTEDWGFTYSLTSDFDKPFHHFAVAQTKGITAHPFVAKDKNGKDVFAGDRIKYRSPDIDELCEDEKEILEASIAGGFYVYDVEGTDFVEASKFEDIELIEDKDDNY